MLLRQIKTTVEISLVYDTGCNQTLALPLKTLYAFCGTICKLYVCCKLLNTAEIWTSEMMFSNLRQWWHCFGMASLVFESHKTGIYGF